MNISQEEYRENKKLWDDYLKQFPEEGQKTLSTMGYHFGPVRTMEILKNRQGRKIKLTDDPEILDHLDYYYE